MMQNRRFDSFTDRLFHLGYDLDALSCPFFDFGCTYSPMRK